MPSLSSNIADVALVAPVRARPPGLLAGLLIGYLAVLVTAWISGNSWLQGLAAFALATALLSPALRRGSPAAWAVWLAAGGALALLVARGDGRAALDLLPVLIDSALCVLFARTLTRGGTPLIAQAIVILEGAARLALPRVARYARQLTIAWALLFGVQAGVMLIVLLSIEPDGLLATFGISSPLHLAPAWRWYLYVGSYAAVIVFMLAEYFFRCWYLRQIPHQPLGRFLRQLARRWPLLLSQLAEPPPRSRP